MPRYQQWHYEDVAQILEEERQFQSTSGRPEGLMATAVITNLSCTFADLFAADNPNFNRGAFLAACGLESS